MSDNRQCEPSKKDIICGLNIARLCVDLNLISDIFDCLAQLFRHILNLFFKEKWL